MARGTAQPVAAIVGKSNVMIEIIRILSAAKDDSYVKGKTIESHVVQETGRLPNDAFSKLRAHHGVVEEKLNKDQKPGSDEWRLTELGHQVADILLKQRAASSAAPATRKAGVRAK